MPEIRSFRACAGRSVNRKLSSAPKRGRKRRIRPWVQAAVLPTLRAKRLTRRRAKRLLAIEGLSLAELALSELALSKMARPELALLPNLTLQRKLLA